MNDDKRSSRKGLIVFVCIAFTAAMFLLCSFQVRTTEVALKSTLGKLSPDSYEAGFHWKLPWPFQKVIKLDRSLQIFEGKYEENYTSDEKTLIMTIFATWSITDPQKYIKSLGSTDTARSKLADLIRTEKGYVISKHPITHLISANPNQRKFEQIEDEIAKRVRKSLEQDGYGIKLESLGIEQINLSPQITKDVFNRMAGERRNKAARIRQEGTLAASRIRADGRIESGKIEAAAREEAKRIRNEGDLAAAEKYQVFEQDRDFAIFLRQLESLESIMSKKTTLVIDREVAPFSLLKGDFLKDTPQKKSE